MQQHSDPRQTISLLQMELFENTKGIIHVN